MTSKSTDLVIVKFDYKPTDIHELAIQKGERLTLLDDTQHWWRVMNAQGATGYVPSNYVKRSKQGIFSSLRNTLGRRKSRQDDSNGVTVKHGSVESLGHKYSQPTPAVDIFTGGLAPVDGARNVSTFNQFSTNADGSDSIQRTGTSSFDIPGDETQDDRTHPGVDNWGGSVGTRHHNSSQALSSVPVSVTGSLALPRQNGHGEPPVPMGTSQQSDQTVHLQQPPPPVPQQQQTQLQHTASLDPNPYFGTGSGLGRHICQALFAYPASQPDELSIERGDKIRVLERSSDGWWRGVLVTDGRPALMGWFPSNYVTLDLTKNLSRAGSTSQPNSLNSTSLGRTAKESLVSHTTMTMQAQLQAQLLAQHYQSSKTLLSSGTAGPGLPPTASTSVEFKQGYRPSPSRETVLTLYPFVRNQIEEMSFDANEVLDVLEKPADDPDWWRCRNVRGETGLVPRNYVRLITATTTTTTTTICATATTNATAAASKTVTTAVSGRASALDPYGFGPPHSAASNTRADGDTLRLTYALRSNTARAHAHQPWCWGAISRAECETMLGQYSRPGEFIIRDSESHPGDLTVTINAGSKTRNFKVHVERDQYHIGQKVFGSIDDLIEHYRSHPIFKNDQEKHYLTRPFVHPGDAATTAPREPNPKLAPYVSSGGVICHPVGGLQPRYS